MKPYLLAAGIIGIFSAGFLAGANKTPLLTGSGYIRFPESSTPASLHASSGTLALAAGGSNQNITLTPTGSGGVGIGGTPAYLLDVSGDINTSGVFRKGGTAGVSASVAIPGGGGITTSGGVVTALNGPATGASGTFTTPGGGALVLSGGIATAIGNPTTGLTGTYSVRNSTNTGSCTLVFVTGILTAETC